METLALILAGGRGSRLDILSEKRVKPSIPFAGKYRIIDFTLSNCTNSGIYNIAILTQYLPLSLNEHIGVGKPWDLDRRDSRVTLLQPHNNWYLGTADAVKKNINFIKRKNPKYVLILSGDHVYKMDYRKLVKQHEETKADLTIATKIIPLEEGHRFGIMEINRNLKIKNFEEKPEFPKSNLASMGIYIFNTELLIDILGKLNIENLDFGKHVIPTLIHSHNVYAYEFDDYWKDVGTYESYLEANLEMINDNNKHKLDMYDDQWKIYTRSEDRPAVKIGNDSYINQSLISNGCIINGNVNNSVLSPGVIIHPNAKVNNSVILNNVIIKSGVEINNAIVDKNCVINENSTIGYGDIKKPNDERPDLLTSGITVIGKGVMIPKNTIIERNCRVFSSSSNSLKDNLVIKCGSTNR